MHALPNGHRPTHRLKVLVNRTSRGAYGLVGTRGGRDGYPNHGNDP